MKNFAKTKRSQLTITILNPQQQLKIKGGTDDEVTDIIVDDMIDV